MNVLAQARRRMVAKLLLLGALAVAPVAAGLVWGIDGFLLAAFGVPAAAICLFAITGGNGGKTKNWPHAM